MRTPQKIKTLTKAERKDLVIKEVIRVVIDSGWYPVDKTPQWGSRPGYTLHEAIMTAALRLSQDALERETFLKIGREAVISSLPKPFCTLVGYDERCERRQDMLTTLQRAMDPYKKKEPTQIIVNPQKYALRKKGKEKGKRPDSSGDRAAAF